MQQKIKPDCTVVAELSMKASDKNAQFEPLAYSPAQAARVLGISRGSLYSALGSDLPSFKLGRRRLIRRSDLLAFMEQALEAAVKPKLSYNNARGA